MPSVHPTKVDPKTGKPARGTRWRVRDRDERRRSRTETFYRKQDADARAAELETDLRRRDYIDPRNAERLFDDLADKWWASTVNLAPHTRRGYHVLLTLHVLPHFGGRRQGDIEWLDVEQFVS